MNMTTSILFYLLVTTFKLLQEYNFNPNKCTLNEHEGSFFFSK